MKPVLTVAQMRAADRYAIDQLLIPPLLLMARAGRAVADAVVSLLSQSPSSVCIVVGTGNNGGDGLLAAAELTARGIRVDVLLTTTYESLRDDAASCYHALSALTADHPDLSIEHLKNIPHEKLSQRLNQADIIIDALFGTGLSRPIDGHLAQWIHCINGCKRPILSIDIASGLDGDHGFVSGSAIQATWTLPIAAPTWGLWCGDGLLHSGKILPACDIGIPPSALLRNIEPACHLINHHWLKEALPSNSSSNAHKGHYGNVWIFGGSQGYTGAPQLAALGAIAAHAGAINIACPDEQYPVIAAAPLECMVHPVSKANWQQADCIVAGPGWGQKQQNLLHSLLDSNIPMVLDADALNIVAAYPEIQRQLLQRESPTVITPHPGEAARLLNTSSTHIQQNRQTALMQLQQKFGCTVVLKGAGSLIANQHQQRLCPFGSSRLARAGSGDVLAGVVGALLARGIPSFDAASLAVGWHALAGEQKSWFSISELPSVIAHLMED